MRIAALALGLAVFAWLPLEDTTTTVPQLLALGAGLLIALRGYLLSRRGAIIWGMAGGLAAGPAAALFMLVKSGLHGHGSIPDFSIADYTGVLGRSLIFALAGALIGAGLDFYNRAG